MTPRVFFVVIISVRNVSVGVLAVRGRLRNLLVRVPRKRGRDHSERNDGRVSRLLRRVEIALRSQRDTAGRKCAGRGRQGLIYRNG